MCILVIRCCKYCEEEDADLLRCIDKWKNMYLIPCSSIGTTEKRSKEIYTCSLCSAARETKDAIIERRLNYILQDACMKIMALTSNNNTGFTMKI